MVSSCLFLVVLHGIIHLRKLMRSGADGLSLDMDLAWNCGAGLFEGDGEPQGADEMSGCSC